MLQNIFVHLAVTHHLFTSWQQSWSHEARVMKHWGGLVFKMLLFNLGGKRLLKTQQLSSAEDCIFENVTTLWLKHPTLKITSIPLPQRVPFSCQQSFCWNRRPVFKWWISCCEMTLFRGKNLLFTVITLECQTVAAATVWLLPPEAQAGDAAPTAPHTWVPKERRKKKNTPFVNSSYSMYMELSDSVSVCLAHISMQIRVIS